MNIKDYRTLCILMLVLLLCAAGCSKDKAADSGGEDAVEKSNTDFEVNRSYNLVPPETSTILYVKNLDKVRKILEESDLVTSLKDNYIYQDFKYKYLQDRKLFFVTLDLNLDKILDMVNQDFLYCRKEGEGSFIVAHATLKTRVLNMVFNIINGSSIVDKEYEGVTYKAVRKGSGTVFYAMLSDYLTISDSAAVMEQIITVYTGQGQGAQEDLDKMCSDEDIYFKTNMKEGYNAYDILPDFSSTAFIINARTGAASIKGLPIESVKLGENPVSSDILKIIPKEFALFYYKRDYPLQENLQSVINSIVNNTSSSQTKKAGKKLLSSLDVFEQCKEGVCISVNSLGNPKSRTINPQFALFLEMKEGQKGKDYAKQLMNIFSFVLDTDTWTASEENDYILYTSKNNGFSLLVTDRYAALCNDKDFTGSIITNITTPGPSLYDTYAKEIKSLPADIINFACINPARIVEGTEPLFMQYISSKVTINKDEYDNGFGRLFGYVKEKKPVFISLSYKSEDEKYDGRAVFLK